MKIRDMRNLRKTGLQTIQPDKTVHQAIKQLCDHNIGALPVCDAGGSLVGIISERDVLRLCARDDCRDALQQSVEAVMTRDLVIGLPDDDLDYVMRVMTERRIRHLPVLENDRLVTIVSIGDVVKAHSDEVVSEARFLRDYLSGATA